MSRAVVVVKIKYYQAGNRGQSPWRRHLEYIATKPHADRGDEEALRVGDDDYPLEPDTAAAHARYAAGRPGSSGLFGPDGPAGWRDVARDLDGHGLPAWRVIVSMREDDAAQWGLVSREKWEAAVRAAVRDAARAMHLHPDRTRWVAAYHAKPGQPHAHLVIWEAPHAGARRRGLLEEGERRGVWRAFARELFREERDRLAAEKAALRQAVRELARGDAARAAEITREARAARLEAEAMDGRAPGVQPVPREGREAEFARRLEALAAALPGRGRVALAYMPPEVRARARQTADWLLAQPGFRQAAERYEELARRFAEHRTAKPEAHTEATRKARDDLRDRVAQVVLQAAAGLNRELHALDRPPLSPGARERAKVDAARRFARGAWTAGWRAVERERLRMEAACLLARRREMERRTRRRGGERICHTLSTRL